MGVTCVRRLAFCCVIDGCVDFGSVLFMRELGGFGLF